MRKRFWQVLFMVSLVAVTASGVWAARGGGKGQTMSPANRQADEDARRGRERAAERRSEQVTEHARSGDQDGARGMREQREQVRDPTQMEHRERGDRQDRDRMHSGGGAQDKLKTKDKARDHDRDRDRVGDRAAGADRAPASSGEDAGQSKKRWWWPFGE